MSRAERSIGNTFIESACFRHKRTTVGKVRTFGLTHHLKRHEHLLTATQIVIYSGAKRKVNAELVPGIIFVIRTHLAAESPIFHRVRIHYPFADSLIYTVHYTRSAVVLDIVVTVCSVFGSGFTTEHG